MHVRNCIRVATPVTPPLHLFRCSQTLYVPSIATPQEEGEAGGEGGNEQPAPEGDADELELGLDLAKKK